MDKINVPFAHGFYTSDSLPVSAQSCINFYPVIEDQPSLQQETLRGTPGIYHVANTGTTSADTNRGGHGLNGVPYFVFGTGLYRLESDETLTSLGTISGTKRCIFADNGTQLFIMQANGNGYIFTESPDTLTQITDVDYTTTNGTPQSVAFIDGYFVVTTDEKKFIVSALNDGLAWSALDFGTAESSPDGVVTPVVFQNQLFIGGERTIEAFTNIGGAGFPFTRSGLFLDAGISSVYSVVNAPNTFVWLGAGENEVPAIWMFEGNTKRKISTRAIDSILAGLSATKLLKVFAWAYSQGGNYFVGFNTHKNTTIVYDMTTEKWHERRSYYTGMVNADGDPWRAGCLVDAYGKIYVGDQYSHKVGVLDPDVADEMDAAGGTTSNRIYREFSTMPFQNDMKNMFVPYIELVVEGGLEDTPAYPDSYPECEDYSCNAFQEVAPTVVDFFYPLNEATYTGALTYNYVSPEASGQADLLMTGRVPADTQNPIDSNVHVIFGDCTKSWYVNDGGSGTHGCLALISDPSDQVGVSTASQGCVLKTISLQPSQNPHFSMHYEISYSNPSYHDPIKFEVSTVTISTERYLRVVAGATETDVRWLDHGIDPDAEGIWIHADFSVERTTATPRNNEVDMIAKVYANGDLITTVANTFTQTVFLDWVSLTHRDTRWGYGGSGFPRANITSMYYSDSATSDADRDILEIAFDRNQTTYTQPDWCPGPRP